MNERAMILAAGMGVRLQPLTENRPKPMMPVFNVPVVEHTLRLLKRSGIKSVISNVHYLPGVIMDYFGDGTRLDMELSWSYEGQLRGTAGGVRKCAEFLRGDTFLVVSGDALTDIDLRAFLDFHREVGALASIVVTEVTEMEHYGIVLSGEDGLVHGFQEKPRAAEALGNIANSGIYAFEPEVLDMIPTDRPFDFGCELFPQLVRENAPLYAWKHASYWNDIGSLEAYRDGCFDALAGNVELELTGFTNDGGIYLGEEVKIDGGAEVIGPVCLGDGTVVEEGAQIIGPVMIGDNVRIGSGSSLHSSIIWENTVIGNGASLAGAIVGSSSVIGSNARLNEGAVVGDGEQLGQGEVVDPPAE